MRAFEANENVIICPHADGDHVLDEHGRRADEVCEMLWSSGDRQDHYKDLILQAPLLYDLLAETRNRIRQGVDIRKEPGLLRRIDAALAEVPNE